MNKYHNRRIEADGHKFDSAAECNRYYQLKLLERSGEIRNLQVHPVYLLQERFKYAGKWERAITYEADFAYVQDDRVVVEDVKGVRTPVYLLKRKLFLKQFGYDFIEIEVK